MENIDASVLVDPATFFEYTTRNKPFEYQELFLRDNSQYISVRSGRQIGKTTMAANKALYSAFMYPNWQVLILAPVQRQASLLFWQIKEILSSNHFIKSKTVRETLTQIHFDNGSQIHCLPAGKAGKTIRGFSPNLIIMDEAAYIPDEVYETVIEPSLAITRGSVIMISTPFGKQGKFYDSFQPGSTAKNYHIPCSRCPKISKEWIKNQKRKLPEMIYWQEIEGEFTEEADNWYPISLVKGCIKDVEQIDVGEKDKRYRLGVDVARFGEDRIVFMVGEVAQNKVIIRKIITASKKRTTYVTEKIRQLHRDFNFEVINIDETTFGGVVDPLIEEDKDYPIVPCKMYPKDKEEYHTLAKLLMENNKLEFPDHHHLIHELINLKFRKKNPYLDTNNNIQIYHPPRGHDDHVDALVLLCKGLKIMGKSDDEEGIYMRSG